MANIPLLQNGCSGQDIIDTVNAIIASINSGGGLSISYNDLTDKPSINGVEIAGALSTALIRIAISDTEGYSALLQTLATKAYADAVKTEALSAAQTAVAAALADKMDKDLGNIDAIDYFSKEALLPIVTKEGVKKTTLANIASYTKIQNETAMSAVDTALAKERKTLTLEGEQDGTNKVFTVTEGYKPGTGMLYLNGVLQSPDEDYEETDSRTITLIHIAPESEDKLTFRAVPAT